MGHRASSMAEAPGASSSDRRQASGASESCTRLAADVSQSEGHTLPHGQASATLPKFNGRFTPKSIYTMEKAHHTASFITNRAIHPIITKRPCVSLKFGRSPAALLTQHGKRRHRTMPHTVLARSRCTLQPGPDLTPLTVLAELRDMLPMNSEAH